MVEEEEWCGSGVEVVVRQNGKDDVGGDIEGGGNSVAVAIERATRGLRYGCRA